ncbi:MAG: phosphoribosylanthranilate isomerase, partial [Pyrinomonadaceae bacterium]
MTPKIKICCIASVEEAALAVEFGAAAVGLVAKMPSGPGPIADELIRTIAANVPPPIATFRSTRTSQSPRSAAIVRRISLHLSMRT